MPQFINHYSLLLAALVIFSLLAGFLLRFRPRQSSYLLVGLLLAGTLLAWLLLKPDPTGIGDENQVLDQIGGGQAVLLEFQSPY